MNSDSLDMASIAPLSDLARNFVSSPPPEMKDRDSEDERPLNAQCDADECDSKMPRLQIKDRKSNSHSQSGQSRGHSLSATDSNASRRKIKRSTALKVARNRGKSKGSGHSKIKKDKSKRRSTTSKGSVSLTPGGLHGVGHRVVRKQQVLHCNALSMRCMVSL